MLLSQFPLGEEIVSQPEDYRMKNTLRFNTRQRIGKAHQLFDKTPNQRNRPLAANPVLPGPEPTGFLRAGAWLWESIQPLQCLAQVHRESVLSVCYVRKIARSLLYATLDALLDLIF